MGRVSRRFGSAFASSFASFISRVNAAAHDGFRYDLENVARAARLPGACRTADGGRPARLAPLAVTLLKHGSTLANALRGARLYRRPAPALPGPATRFTVLNRRAKALGRRAR
jgi:hypothetical protein